MTTVEWEVTGFGGCTVKVGDTVRIRERGFRGATATVTSALGNARYEVAIVKADKRTGWMTGNRTSLGVWWLETV
jgi:hypothetical protein